MSCKHLKVKGNTTKYFWCNVKGKSINEYECSNCLLKINDNRADFIENLFGSFKNGYK